jgi:TetR/AcrR family transcriptional repressor of mexJK operon
MIQPSSKHDAILRAARTVFVRAGYKGASMEAIAEEAPVSKPTLYSHFGSKHELFVAVIQAQCTALVGSLDPEATRNLTPEQGLRTIATSFVETLYNPESLALYRLMVAEHTHCPELSILMDQTVVQPTLDLLSTYLRSLHANDALVIQDPESSGQLFLGMLKGVPHFRCAMGLKDGLSPKEQEALIGATLELFIKAHAR